MEFETVAKFLLVLLVVLALYFIVKEINTIKEIFLKMFNIG